MKVVAGSPGSANIASKHARPAPRAPPLDLLIEIKITVYITNHKRYNNANMSTIAPQLEIALKGVLRGGVACAHFLFACAPL